MVAARRSDFVRHLEALAACRVCPQVRGIPITGGVWNTRVMLVGQAPGPHEAEHSRPFAYTAGKRLFQWFAGRGISETRFREHVHICAVIRCFPGKDAKGSGDRVPDGDEIARCGAHLDREIAMLRPKLVIAVGTLAAAQLVGTSVLTEAVGRVHRASRAGRSFDVVVLPHPSGRSTWLNRSENRDLLEASMTRIVEHEAMRAWMGSDE